MVTDWSLLEISVIRAQETKKKKKTSKPEPEAPLGQAEHAASDHVISFIQLKCPKRHKLHSLGQTGHSPHFKPCGSLKKQQMASRFSQFDSNTYK